MLDLSLLLTDVLHVSWVRIWNGWNRCVEKLVTGTAFGSFFDMQRSDARSLAGVARQYCFPVWQGDMLSISVDGDQVLLRLVDFRSSGEIKSPTIVWHWPRATVVRSDLDGFGDRSIRVSFRAWGGSNDAGSKAVILPRMAPSNP